MSEAPNSHLGDSRREMAVNNPREWYYTRAMPLLHLKKWQRRIDEIVGTALSGGPRIRVVWAWDSWAELYERRWQRYSFFTFRGEDISVPRFAIEQRIEPEQFYDAWESTRYQRATDGATTDCGPAPQEWWDTLWVIADHEGYAKENPKAWCCQRAAKMNRPCWGFYRPPAEWDVNEIARIHALKCADERANKLSPFKPLSSSMMDSLKKAAFERAEEGREKARGELKQRLVDHFTTHGHRLSTDPSVVKHGRYHFVEKFQRKDSGLYLPKN